MLVMIGALLVSERLATGPASVFALKLDVFTGFSPTRYFDAGHRTGADVDGHHTT
jgi:hypothetical protein